jgi:hypothetical protein
MAIVEYHTPVSHRSLMNKRKDDLVRMLMDEMATTTRLLEDARKMKAAIRAQREFSDGWASKEADKIGEVLDELGKKYDPVDET